MGRGRLFSVGIFLIKNLDREEPARQISEALLYSEKG
jgi:hypothetical protein